MRQPYIGITGFMSKNEVQSVLDSMPKNSNRLLMVGVLASQKTLLGFQNKWPNRYPKVEDISKIFVRDKRVLNLIHYSTDKHHEFPTVLIDELVEMSQLGGDNFQGFQLNIAWPSRGAIAEFRRYVPNKVIVLQIGGKALRAINHSPKNLVSDLIKYEELVDYILIDPSGGLGIPFDTEKARAYLRAIRAKNLNLGLGIAGGLSPTTLNLVEPLVSEFPDLSIDAEGRLRDSEDNLDLNVAGQYVQGACNLFSKREQTSVKSNIRLCSQCGVNPVHYNLSVCYDCEYYD